MSFFEKIGKSVLHFCVSLHLYIVVVVYGGLGVGLAFAKWEMVVFGWCESFNLTFWSHEV